VIGHGQGSEGHFFVFHWATHTKSFLFSFGVQGLNTLEGFLFLQFGVLFSGFSLEIVDLSGTFFIQ
jgi:hypothetical protein